VEQNSLQVNIMSCWFVEAANHTCGDYPFDVDELALTGLTGVPSAKVCLSCLICMEEVPLVLTLFYFDIIDCE
jgi:hypothetical protein